MKLTPQDLAKRWAGIYTRDTIRRMRFEYNDGPAFHKDGEHHNAPVYYLLADVKKYEKTVKFQIAKLRSKNGIRN